MTSLRIMRPEEWPGADRMLWERANRSGPGPLEIGPAADLSPKSKRQLVKVYGQFLTWYQLEIGDPAAVEPIGRITESNLRAHFEYLLGCRSRQSGEPLSQVTIANRIAHVGWMVSAMYPGLELDWLREIVGRLNTWARPARDKRRRLVPIEDLVEAGLTFMARAEVEPARGHMQPATGYRDGLLMLLFAVTGRRLSNMAAIAIGRHLERLDGRYRLSFEAEEMKHRGGGAERNIPLPAALSGPIDRYLASHRPVLLGDELSGRLWISMRGTPMSEQAIYYSIRRVTEATLGVRLNPHIVRDCIATSMAVEDSVLASMIARILSHSSPATTKRYYDHSRSLEASRTAALLVAERRAESPASRLHSQPATSERS